MKPFLDKQTIAMRAALELKDGDVVNLGAGIPYFLLQYIPPDIDLVWHSETGAINYGNMLSEEEEHKRDFDYVLAGGQFFLPRHPGLAIADHAITFLVAQSGRLDVSILGGMEVSETGDLANWSEYTDVTVGGIGGGMDFAYAAKRLIVTMTHVTKDGKPKVLKRCRLPLTVKGRVDTLITDLAVIKVTDKGLMMLEIAPGWNVEEVQALTEASLLVSPDLKEIQL